MDAIIAWLFSDWKLIALLMAVALLGASMQYALATNFRKPTKPRRWSYRAKGRLPNARKEQPTVLFDSAAQLRAVEQATFKSRHLLNRGEARLLRVLEEACAAEAPEWRVMAQVSLGEILSSPCETAYRAINSKRVDLLLVGADGLPKHAVEFQGSGHHVGPAATRDAVKKEALRKAGVGYIEIMPGDTPAEVRLLIRKLASRLASAEARSVRHPFSGSIKLNGPRT
jgi:hypothetical protein